MFAPSYVRSQLCSHPAMFATDHVRNQLCSQPAMFATNDVRNKLCSQPAMFATSYVRNQLCSQPAMFATSRPHAKRKLVLTYQVSCTTNDVYSTCRKTEKRLFPAWRGEKFPQAHPNKPQKVIFRRVAWGKVMFDTFGELPGIPSKDLCS